MAQRLPTVVTLLLLLSCTSCRSKSADNLDSEKQTTSAIAAMHSETKRPRSFQNVHLKQIIYPDEALRANADVQIAEGVWTPESDEPGLALVFPEQVSLRCDRKTNACTEIYVTLGVLNDMVSIIAVEERAWSIDSWDEHGLRASYGPDLSSLSASDRCHNHVLTISFRSGAISNADIPTQEAGCEAFKHTDSYRLTRGNYWIDTSPANDAEKR